MKFALLLLLSCYLLFTIAGGAPSPAWSATGYSGYNYNYDGYNSYRRGNGGYYGGQTRREYGKSSGNEGGSDRYKSIARVHAVDSLAFPGKIGNPVYLYRR
ncbi:unnamed protein product [Phyllotreta striolata]|uniref:Uncharacterized protein n=1 Tax=Phyllotreta striolata TaxID=444603 RepID=A0A9N9TTM8_PHYSR|nr:unnamed protein product [Phyllotreta striolata]